MYWVIPSEITSGVRKLDLVDTGITWFAEDRYLVIDLDDLEAEWVTYDQLYNVFRKYSEKFYQVGLSYNRRLLVQEAVLLDDIYSLTLSLYNDALVLYSESAKGLDYFDLFGKRYRFKVNHYKASLILEYNGVSTQVFKYKNIFHSIRLAYVYRFLKFIIFRLCLKYENKNHYETYLVFDTDGNYVGCGIDTKDRSDYNLYTICNPNVKLLMLTLPC